ncbi:MAG TPA: hypothetical protein V6D15_20010 [Oculatellaceae cyanobacterium]|jgi:F0F1-type ATP synthase assembly protein I
MNQQTKDQLVIHRTLSESLLRLSVSPVKADREAITRLEREAGKDIQAIIQDLDSNEIALQAIYDQQQKPVIKKFVSLFNSGIFIAGVIGIVTVFTKPSHILVALILGFVTGVTGAALRHQNK